MAAKTKAAPGAMSGGAKAAPGAKKPAFPGAAMPFTKASATKAGKK